MRLQTRIQATSSLIIATLIAGCVSAYADDSEDGYALFEKACQLHATFNPKYDDPLSDELQSFSSTGGIPSTDLLSRLEHEQPVFDLIARAAAAKTWRPPDCRTFSDETKFPNIGLWRSINKLATAKSIVELQNGRAMDSLNHLAIFNDIGMRSTKLGTLIHALVDMACRTAQYPVLSSAIDVLQKDDLNKYFAISIRQYEQIPTIQECFFGEHFMEANTVKRFFANIQTNEALKTAPSKLADGAEKANMRKEDVEKIREGKILSVQQWEAQALADVAAIESTYMKALDAPSARGFQAVESSIEKQIVDSRTDMTSDAGVATWSRYIKSLETNALSLVVAERFHAQIGRVISNELLGLLIPEVHMSGLRYRGYVANERLLLIRMAARIYATKHGSAPKALQDLVDDQLLTKDMITDPMSGELFLLKKGSDTFEAYSVGRDFDDDNGQPWDSENDSGDIILVPLHTKENTTPVHDP